MPDAILESIALDYESAPLSQAFDFRRDAPSLKLGPDSTIREVAAELRRSFPTASIRSVAQSIASSLRGRPDGTYEGAVQVIAVGNVPGLLAAAQLLLAVADGFEAAPPWPGRGAKP